ncbi:MAG: helix-turn-helix domain containing protein [Actinobacteria bacterium]|nr:helix-turn-helix domain containing protein [Actinomycetota bacterium]
MSPRGRTPQRRVLRNDERILDAALELLADSGWGAFTLVAVGARAGLSKRPVLDRFASREVLAATLWRQRLASPLTDALLPLLSGDVESLDTFLRPNPALNAAAELLVVRQYEPRVLTAVNRTLSPLLVDALDPPRPRADAARTGYLLMLALGLLLVWPGSNSVIPDIVPLVTPIRDALAQRRKPVRQPARKATHIDGAYPFDTDDPVLAGLLQATLEQVGTRGFDAATTRAISRAGGLTEGYLFNRYATKLELVFDASRSSIAGGAGLNERFMAGIEREYSAGMAEAVMLRELMRPGREVQRSINLEQQRLMRHHPALRASSSEQYRSIVEQVQGTSARWRESSLDADSYVGLSVGFGAVLLAQLHPTAWNLPYDVVTCAAV